MVWCRNCQHENDQGAIFCSYCGQPMDSKHVTPPVEPSIGATVDLKRDYKPFETPTVVPAPPYIPNLAQSDSVKPKQNQQQHNFFKFVFVVAMIFFGLPIAFRVIGGLFQAFGGVFQAVGNLWPLFIIGGIVYMFVSSKAQANDEKHIGLRIALAALVLITIPHMWWLIFPIMFVGSQTKHWSCQNHNKGPKQYKH